LSWHPTKENLIAYGTEDGRVGIYDILSSRFVIIAFQTLYFCCHHLFLFIFNVTTIVTARNGLEQDMTAK